MGKTTGFVWGRSLMLALSIAATAQLVGTRAFAAEMRPGGSAEVLLGYPSSTSGISVGRTGEATFGLRIPSFPAYLQPDLVAVYSSRGGDGPLGMGWSIPIAHVALDLSNGSHALETSPNANIVTAGGKKLLIGRWVAAPGGDLVCEPRQGASGTSWTDDDCYTNPRGPIRYTPSGTSDALSWTATDPMEGVTQTFGSGPATRVMNGEKVVTWLLASETSRDGKRVRHFYEERKGTDERLRVAVLMGGDKVVRFVYERRATNLLANYRWTVRRTSEWLLKEIRLISGCVPVQHQEVSEDIWTDFSSCDKAKVLDKVVLSYGDPAQRYTGRYVLTSWQHTSGDGRVAYEPTRFAYNGDGGLSRRGTGIATATSATFPMPHGSTLVSSSGYAPMQNYVDWNRDGLADWVDVKNDTSAPWPKPTSDHKIYVSLRNASGTFDTRYPYKEPLSRYAAWVWDDGSGVELHQNALDKRLLGLQIPMSRNAPRAAIAAKWPEANIAINTTPWLYRVPGKDDTTTYMPIFESLSMTIACAKLGTAICGSIKDTYRTVWGATLGTYDHVGVKLSDLQDLDGDGYLDRVVSGLLVIWDPAAPDADTNGWRAPERGEPCVYVSRFDPASNDFLPFVRYALPRPTGDFSQLSTAFVSALGVEITHNQDPGGGDMSNHGAPISGISAIGIGLDILGGLSHFLQPHPSTESGSSSKASSALGTGVAVTDAVFAVANAAAEFSGSPDLQHDVALARTVYGFARSGMGMVSGIRDVVTKSAVAGTATLSGTAAQVVGWASFTSAVVGAIAAVVTLVWSHDAQKHMGEVGYNPAAVAAVAKTGIAVVSMAAAGVAIVASGVTLGFAIAAGGFAFGWTGVGLIVGIVGGLIALGAAIGALLSKEGSLAFSEGETDFDIHAQRGIVWRDKDVNAHTATVNVMSMWADLDGNGRVDLVVAKHRAGRAGLAIARGESDEGEKTPAAQPWQAWSFAGTASAEALFTASDAFYFMPGDVQRGDRTNAIRGLADLNGDGLLDLVDTSAASPYGVGVFLNTGRGFAAKTTFAASQGSAPPSCDRPLHLARSRALSWTESVDKKTGYMVSLSTTTQLLGPDLDNNGLPDLVMRDERSYPAVSSGGGCVRSSDRAMCDAAMPTDPEPERGNNETCTSTKDVWFAHFDGAGNHDGDGEADSHLTAAGFAVHSPSQLADTYVAFNTGNGFSPFVKLDAQLPAFGGGLNVVSTTNAVDNTPTEAVTGTSHFLADPDASGRMHLIGLDISQKTIWNPAGTHPVATRHVFGITNPDALTKVTYPEGGTATLSYRLHKDVQGEQGPPLWVLSSAVYDDKARASLEQLEGWSGTSPSVQYHYDGAKLVGREFRGFAAIAEERFSGADITQIIQTFAQDGPTRGAVLCTEVRGASIDVAKPLGAIPQHGTCDVARARPAPTGVIRVDPIKLRGISVSGVNPVMVARESPATRESSPDRDTPVPDVKPVTPRTKPWDDDTGQITSCYTNAAERLGLPSLYTLQERTENAYDSAATINRTLPDGTTDHVLRDFDKAQVKSSTYNGAGSAAWVKLEITYDRPPFKTPQSTTLTTSDGIRRKTETKWKHDRAAWAFLRVEQRDLERDGRPRRTTTFAYDTSPPFHIRKVTERGGGTARERSYLAFDSGGLPTTVQEGGVTTTYRYVGDSACGTGLVQSIARSGDAFQPATGVESWTYDCMGRPTSHTTPGGAVSRTTYDALGVLAKDNRAGRGAVTYRHYTGTQSAGRTLGAILGAPRTQRIETIGGQQRWSTVWWDGFFREYRRGVSVEASRRVDLDFDSNGTAVPTTFSDDNAWFTRHGGSFVLEDLLLTGRGEAQCHSTPYLDAHKPEAYKTTLYDPLRRVTLTHDFDGFEVKVRYGVDGRGHTNEHRENQLGEYGVTTRDALGRTLGNSESALSKISFQYGDWGEWTRSTNGAGMAEIIERNAWDQPMKQCRQLSGTAPPVDQCPAGWPTRSTRYDANGLADRTTDERGATTEITNAACRLPGRVVLPPARTGDPSTAGSIETRFDADCRPIEVREPGGVTSTTSYRPDGQVRETVSAKGTPDSSRERFGYDEVGRALYTEDGLGRRTYQILDFRDRPIYAYRADGTRTSTTYDVHGHPASTSDAAGNLWKLETDVLGRVEQATTTRAVCGAVTPTSAPVANLSVSTRIGRDPKGRIIDQWDALGNRTHFVRDQLGRVTRIHPPSLTVPGAYDAAQYTELTYDAAGNVIAERDLGGHVTHHVFDGGGRHTASWSDATGHRIEERFEYDDTGAVIRWRTSNASATTGCSASARGPDAFTYEYRYSPRGLLESTVMPADATGVRAKREVRYDVRGDAIEVTDGRGQTSKLTYDRLHRLIAFAAPDNRSRYEQRWDRASQLVELRDRTLITTFAYDANGRRTGVTRPGGARQVSGYDNDGRLLFTAALADSAAQRWEAMTYTYATGGIPRRSEAAKFVGASPNITGMVALGGQDVCYDAAGRLGAAVDAGGRTTKRGYDARGRITGEKIPGVYGGAAETVDYTYDAEGLLTSVRAPMGGTSAPTSLAWVLAYDGAHRRISQTSPYAADRTEWRYDDEGRVCSRRDVHGAATSREVTSRYDERGSRIERTTTPGGTERFQYDGEQLMVSASDNTGIWAWTRDPLGRVTEQRHKPVRLGTEMVTSFVYTQSGEMARVGLPQLTGFTAGPRSIEYDYDPATDRLRSVKTDLGVVASGLAYDGRGRITSVTLGNGAIETQRWDDLGRIVSKRTKFGARDIASMRYAYDTAGNVTQIDDLVDNAFDFAFTYDERNRLRTEAAGTLGGTWTYKLNSQDRIDVVSPPSGVTRTSQYDARGNLKSIISGAATSTYAYDDHGNRTIDPLHKVKLAYDVNNRVSSATTPSGTIASTYAFDARRVTTGDQVELYGLDHLPLAHVQIDASGKPTGLVYDIPLDGLRQSIDAATGTTRFYGTDYQRSPIVAMDRAPGGETFSAYSASGRVLPRGSTPLASALGFQGSVVDRSTGFDLMLYRSYDAETAEWVSPDPLGLAVGTSSHAFASANPLRYSDPFGLVDGDHFEVQPDGTKAWVVDFTTEVEVKGMLYLPPFRMNSIDPYLLDTTSLLALGSFEPAPATISALDDYGIASARLQDTYERVSREYPEMPPDLFGSGEYAIQQAQRDLFVEAETYRRAGIEPPPKPLDTATDAAASWAADHFCWPVWLCILGVLEAEAGGPGDSPPPPPTLPKWIDIDQTYGPKTPRTTFRGVVRNNPRDWRGWVELLDELGAGEAVSPANRALIKEGRAPYLDAAWVRYFPEEAPYLTGSPGNWTTRLTLNHTLGSPYTEPVSDGTRATRGTTGRHFAVTHAGNWTNVGITPSTVELYAEPIVTPTPPLRINFKSTTTWEMVEPLPVRTTTVRLR